MVIQWFGDICGGFYKFFGIDEASVRIGFEYGFTKNNRLFQSTLKKTTDFVRFTQRIDYYKLIIKLLLYEKSKTNYARHHSVHGCFLQLRI